MTILGGRIMNNKLKKVISMTVALTTLAMSTGMITWAADETPNDSNPGTTQPAAQTTGKIIIKNDKNVSNVSISGKTFTAYRLLELKQNANHDAFAYTLNQLSKDYFNTADAGFKVDYATEIGTADSVASKVDITKPSTVYNFINSLGNAADIEKFANKVYNFATREDAADYSSFKKEATAGNDEKATFNELPLGYYLIYGDTTANDGGSSVVSACMLDTTTWDAEEEAYIVEINAKVGAPTIDKKIVLNKDEKTNETDTTATGEVLVDHDSANIGDTVDFRVNSVVPNVTGYDAYRFWMRDIMSEGLTFDVDSIAVKIGWDKNDNDQIDDNEWMTVNKLNTSDYSSETAQGYVVETATNNNGGTTICVKFVNFYDMVGTNNENIPANAEIRFDYSATLNEKAKIASENNPNSAVINYSNDPHEYEENSKPEKPGIPPKNPDEPDNPDNPDTPETPDTPDTPGGQTHEPKVYVYTYEFDINKYKLKDSEQPDTAENRDSLAGAKFQLYHGTFTGVSIDETVVTPVANGENESVGTPIKFVETTVDGKTVYRVATGAEIADDSITKTDIVESAPDGKIYIVGLKGGEFTTDEDGNVTNVAYIDPQKYTLVEVEAPDGYNLLESPINVEISAEYETDGSAVKNIKADTNANPVWSVLSDKSGILVDVLNQTGEELPSTGGTGTKLIYIGGGVLMLGAVSGYTVRKLAKRKKEE